MESYNESGYHRFDSLLFIVVFFLFIFSFTGKGEDKSSYSLRNTFTEEAQEGFCSFHEGAIVINCQQLALSYIEPSLRHMNTDICFLNPDYILSNYNRKVNQRYIFLYRTETAIEPVLVWKYFHFSHKPDDDLPVLS